MLKQRSVSMQEKVSCWQRMGALWSRRRGVNHSPTPDSCEFSCCVKRSGKGLGRGSGKEPLWELLIPLPASTGDDGVFQQTRREITSIAMSELRSRFTLPPAT